ncbi:MAG: hypothetical protein JWP89_6993 [Schlesneria sp.]|nr:hypothetical protein [Schlesneria sp.]
MSFPSHRKPLLTRPTLGFAWILSIALSSLGTTIASASCGDYLHQMVSDVPTSSVREIPGKPESPRPAVPCTGPACKNAPALPDMPSSVDVRFYFTDRLAVECHSLFNLLETGEQFSRNEAVLLPEGHRAGLERPPRIA